jgi:hypothetical protein
MVEDLPLAVLVATIFFSDATGNGGGGGELVIPSYRISKSICGVELYASSNVKARGSISTLVPILGTLDDVVVVDDDADGFFVFFRDGGRAATAASRYDTMPRGKRDVRPRPVPRGERRSPSSAATSMRRDDGRAAAADDDDDDDDDGDDGEKASADEEQLARIVAAAAAARAMPLRRLRRHCIGLLPAEMPSIVNNDVT